ncbi:MAG: 16S rRNA (guanine(527)-N(7))-methyltransferase RsmG [Pseudomonadota bacterium]
MSDLNETALRRQLDEGLSGLQNATRPNDTQCGQLVAFVALLAKWNKAYNLTAIREPADMVSHHLLDSLTVAPHLHGQRCVDIGTGAGLPGLPLAITHPDKSFLLIDSNSKKTRFITQAVAALSLLNVEVWQGRSEHYEAGAGFDTVMCRAVASLPRLVEIGGHLLNNGGRLVAQKGRMPDAELAELPVGWRATTHVAQVPGLENKTRHIIVLTHH